MSNKGPHAWPTNAADDRNKAAEHMNDADIALARLVPNLSPEEKVVVLQARIELQQGLRLLEKHKAPTTVCATTAAARL